MDLVDQVHKWFEKEINFNKVTTIMNLKVNYVYSMLSVVVYYVD